MKLIARKIWSSRLELIKYVAIGGSSVFLDILSLYILKEYFNLRPLYAIIANQAFLIFYVFLLNKHWTFNNKALANAQFIKFCTLAGTNYCFSIIWMYAWNEQLGFNYLIVRIANIILSTSWNFFIYKFWVYKT